MCLGSQIYCSFLPFFPWESFSGLNFPGQLICYHGKTNVHYILDDRESP